MIMTVIIIKPMRDNDCTIIRRSINGINGGRINFWCILCIPGFITATGSFVEVFNSEHPSDGHDAHDGHEDHNRGRGNDIVIIDGDDD